MPADVINLRKARKARDRAEKEARATERRVQFGRSKAERERLAAEAERRRRELDGARREAAREPPTDSPDRDKDT